MKLSVVTTIYKSERYIEDFFSRSLAATSSLTDLECVDFVFVNDGSPDQSLKVLKNLARSNNNITVVDLSKNFGHHQAILTGLRFAKGDEVFLIDSDLEEDPEWLGPFHERKKEMGVDVVYGVQKHRRGGFIEQLSGYAYYSLFRMLTDIDLPRNMVTARLMSRRYVDALLTYTEKEINIGAMWSHLGFQQVAVNVQKHSTSPTTYSLKKKLHHLVTSVTSFSKAPLVFVFYIGVFVLSISIVYVIYLVCNYLWYESVPDGYSSIIASIWFLSGLMISMMGVLAIYMSKVFSEVKGRPLAVVKEVIRGNSEI